MHVLRKHCFIFNINEYIHIEPNSGNKIRSIAMTTRDKKNMFVFRVIHLHVFWDFLAQFES